MVEIFAQEARDLVAPDAVWEQVAGGFAFVEGPVFVREEGALYFSDIPADTAYRLEEATFRVSVFRRSSGKSNGMTRDPDGFLLACEHMRRRVVRVGRDGLVTQVVAERYGGRRLNSPNDVVVDRKGNIWFTDPTYGISSVKEGQPSLEEQDERAVYRVDRASGAIERVAVGFSQPNGLAFSPDEQILYVGDSERWVVRRFAVRDGGTALDDLGVLVELDPHEGSGPPDGLRVAETGHLFVTGPGGVWVIAPDGRKLARLRLPEVVANCCFGGADGRTLYATATTSIYRIPVRVAGAR